MLKRSLLFVVQIWFLPLKLSRQNPIPFPTYPSLQFFQQATKENGKSVVNASFHVTHWSINPFGTGLSRWGVKSFKNVLSRFFFKTFFGTSKIFLLFLCKGWKTWAAFSAVRSSDSITREMSVWRFRPRGPWIHRRRSKLHFLMASEKSTVEIEGISRTLQSYQL